MAPPSELVRFATAGSVDDGKSTLIGRLLYDTKSIFEDQLEHVEETSRRRGDGYVNLALLTDGLRAEREQGITIDVAYRYFHTPRRKFIIADTPGHEQYTRNMVTGASTADLALILIDARKGVLEQSRRHAFIASLLRIPHLVVCVNKMDLVDFDQEVFDRITRRVRGLGGQARRPRPHLHPDLGAARRQRRRALGADALVRGQLAALPPRARRTWPRTATSRTRASRSSGWSGRCRTSTTTTAATRARSPPGVFRAGDEVVVLPSGRETRIAAIDSYEGEMDEAYPPLSVTLRLEDDIDVSRGDMICRDQNRPIEAREIDAMVCWMAERPLSPRGRYRIKHTTRTALAKIDEVRYRIDVNTLHRDEEADGLELNEIGPPEAAALLAAVRRRVPPQPRDGQLHPHRRVDERHRRCRDGPLARRSLGSSAHGPCPHRLRPRGRHPCGHDRHRRGVAR